MADVRSSQVLAQCEWQETSLLRSFQTLAQVEWEEPPAGWTGKMCGVTNPAKINGVAVADIASVVGQ